MSNRNSTIEDAVKSGPHIVMIGHNRTEQLGSTVFKISPPLKHWVTKPPFCKCWPMMWMDDEWKMLNRPPLEKPWDQPVTIIEELPAPYVEIK